MFTFCTNLKETKLYWSFEQLTEITLKYYLKNKIQINILFYSALCFYTAYLKISASLKILRKWELFQIAEMKWRQYCCFKMVAS